MRPITVKNPIPGRCACYVTPANTGLRFNRPRQCSRKAVIFKVFDGKEIGFCKFHDPDATAARDAERQAKWKAEFDAKAAVRKRREAESRACDGMADPESEVAQLKAQAAALRELYDAASSMDTCFGTTDYLPGAKSCRYFKALEAAKEALA